MGRTTPTPFVGDNRSVGDKWHLDEMVLTINGKHHDLWRALDLDGYTLDILVQSRRDWKAAKRFFRKLLKRLRYVPRVIVTDKLKSYGAAKREILPGVERRQHKGLNNLAEMSHQPNPQQKRQMRGFHSPKQAQRFLSAHAHIGNLFRIRHRHTTAADYRVARRQSVETWKEATCVQSVVCGHLSRPLTPNIVRRQEPFALHFRQLDSTQGTLENMTSLKCGGV